MKNKIFSLIVIISTFSSCTDYLEQKPVHQISLNAPIDTKLKLEIRTNGLYAILQSKDYYGRTFALLPDLMSDNSFIEKNNNRGAYLDFDDYAVNSINFKVENLWTLIYRTVISANIIFINLDPSFVSYATLEDFDTPNLDSDIKNLLGETLALRSLAYFDLVRMYAQPYNYTTNASHLGVPIISINDTKKTLNGTIISPSRNSVKEVYNQIIDDLELASKLLSDNNGPFRVDKFSVKALLSRIYLYKEDWEKAMLNAEYVINNGDYSLITATNYIASWEEKNSTETIFSVQFTDLDNLDLSSFSYHYVGTFDGGVTKNLFTTFRSQDVRKNLFSRSSSRDMYILRRKYDPLRKRPYQSCFPVLRLSEIYLNRAEARYHLNNNLGALSDLNRIKNRGLGGNILSGVTGNTLLNEILKERRRELSFEGHRLFDLTRNKTDFYKYKNREENTPTLISYPNFRTILPIPQEEIDTNPNIEQNPNY